MSASVSMGDAGARSTLYIRRIWKLRTASMLLVTCGSVHEADGSASQNRLACCNANRMMKACHVH